MRIPFVTLFAGLLALKAPLALAQTHSTDPVGGLAITIPAMTDALLAAPLHRGAVFEGPVTSVSGNTLGFQIPQGVTPWATNQFVFSAPAQTNTYYALVMTGAGEGRYFTITGNTGNTLTVDPAGTSLASRAPVGTIVQVIPYWTMATLFTWQPAVLSSATASGSSAPTEIFFRTNIPGINRAGDLVYYYFGGTNPGWRRRGAGLQSIRDHDIVPPNEPFTFRNSRSVPVTIYVAGEVRLAGFAGLVYNLQANTPQDNFLAHTAPTDITLRQSRLFESGAVRPSPAAGGAGADEVLIVDPYFPGQNKAGSEAYFYWAGSTFGGPGWRRKGASLTTKFDDVPVLRAGVGVMIRRVASPTTSVTDWTFVPPYLQ